MTVRLAPSRLSADVRRHGIQAADSVTQGLSELPRTDIALDAGAFTDGDLTGQFHGSDHAEVGGVFNRDGLSGVFAAVRDP